MAWGVTSRACARWVTISAKDISCRVCTTSMIPSDVPRSPAVNSGRTTVECTLHCCASLALKYTSLEYFWTFLDISGCTSINSMLLDALGSESAVNSSSTAVGSTLLCCASLALKDTSLEYFCTSVRRSKTPFLCYSLQCLPMP